MKKFPGCKLTLFFLALSFSSYTNEKDIAAISETLGHFIKEELDKSQYDINIEKVIDGIAQASKGKTPPLSKEEYDNLVSKIVQKKIDQAEKENLKIANDFFLKNKKNQNVIELIEKKLQYQIISEGTGEKVNNHNTPVISIKGFLPDNTTFLSKQEFVTSLNDLPEGLKLAILGMKENEKRKIYVHPDFTNKIFEAPFPHSLLIYEVEVLKNDKSKIITVDKNIADFSGTVR